MAASTIPSPPHLLLPTSFPPNLNRNLSPLFSSQNPNRNPQLRQFISLNYYFRSIIPIPNPKFITLKSKFTTPKTSSLSPSPVIEASDNENSTGISITLRQLCQGHVPDHVLSRMEEIGFVAPTEVQKHGLPVLFSGSDCVIHAQTGSGKTLTYLLLVYSVINTQRSAVQALIVVPTRELGMQVTKVARMLAANPSDIGPEPQKACTVMALLDGGMLTRHKTWLKADPPTVVVATVASLCQMLEKKVLDLRAMRVLVIDEVDFMFNSSKQVSSLRKLLTSYSSCHSRQTVFASASIPQHNRFLHDCVQQKWTKSDVVHVHVNPVAPMPSCLNHRYMTCHRNQKYEALLSILQMDLPESAILFVNEQSEKSKKAGDVPTTTRLIDFLKSSSGEFSSIALLEDDMNFNARAASLLEVREKSRYLLVATDIAARGVDLPETTHIYNFDLPKSAVHYLHRAGRTDVEDNLLQGINKYRTSLNLTTLTKNNNAECLAGEMADQFKDKPCTNSTGSNTIPGTEEQLPNYPDLLAHCHLNITDTRDGNVMPACVPGLDPALVLSNFTESQYSGSLNDTKFTGAGIGSAGNWVVVVLSTDSSSGSFETDKGAGFSVGPSGVYYHLGVFLLGWFLLW